MYERLKYDDDAWRGYTLGVNDVFPSTGVPQVILTGAYNNPNYEAHLGFIKFAYSF
jgi:hypothetical protein